MIWVENGLYIDHENRIMGYIVPRNDKIMEHVSVHYLYKRWTTYRPIIGLKRGSVYKTINKLKTLNLAEKRAKTQRYRYSASILSILNRCKIHNPKSGFRGAFLFLCQRVSFLHLWHHCVACKVKRSCGELGLHPSFCPSWSKKITAFFGPLLWSRKKSARTHRKNCVKQFCLPIFFG